MIFSSNNKDQLEQVGLESIYSKGTMEGLYRTSYGKASKIFVKNKMIDFEYFGLTWKQRMGCCIGSFLIGVMLLVYSFTKWLTLLLNPMGFVFPYTISNLLFFMMFGFILGFKSYIKSLMGKSKREFTTAFVLSTAITLYSVLYIKSYILSFLLVVIQLVTSATFMISLIPGGSNGIRSLIRSVRN